MGIKSTSEALRYAEDKGLDLVEVAPLAKPPVCKVIDYGIYLYNLKKQKKSQKKVKKTETKTTRLSIRTDKHDLEVKAKKARKFLEDRNMLKVVVIFKGREITHKELGVAKMDEFYKMIEDICEIEQDPKRQGYQLTMMLKPKI